MNCERSNLYAHISLNLKSQTSYAFSASSVCTGKTDNMQDTQYEISYYTHQLGHEHEEQRRNVCESECVWRGVWRTPVRRSISPKPWAEGEQARLCPPNPQGGRDEKTDSSVTRGLALPTCSMKKAFNTSVSAARSLHLLHHEHIHTTESLSLRIH